MCRWHGTHKASVPVAAVPVQGNGAVVLFSAGGCTRPAEQPHLLYGLGCHPQGAGHSSIWNPSAAGKWLALAISCIHDAAWLVIVAADQSSHSKASIERASGADVPLQSSLLAESLQSPAQPGPVSKLTGQVISTAHAGALASLTVPQKAEGRHPKGWHSASCIRCCKHRRAAVEFCRCCCRAACQSSPCWRICSC